MAPKKSYKQITRLPLKITITKEDLDSNVNPNCCDENEKKVQNEGNVEKETVKLASTLQIGFEEGGSYIDYKPSLTKPDDKLPLADYQKLRVEKLMEKSVIKPGFEKLESVPRYIEGKRELKSKRSKEADKTKGDKWFNLPATEMTEEKQRDLEIIQMRSILNPKQFYKKNDLKVVPKYFQVGTVVDNAADFYHNRIPKKDRKKTLVDELMADANFQRYNKRKYAEIIQARPDASGAHRHAKRLKRRKK